MRRNGWKLLLVLICVAFLVSCGKKESHDEETAELVRTEQGVAHTAAPFLLTALG